MGALDTGAMMGAHAADTAAYHGTGTSLFTGVSGPVLPCGAGKLGSLLPSRPPFNNTKERAPLFTDLSSGCSSALSCPRGDLSDVCSMDNGLASLRLLLEEATGSPAPPHIPASALDPDWLTHGNMLAVMQTLSQPLKPGHGKGAGSRRGSSASYCPPFMLGSGMGGQGGAVQRGDINGEDGGVDAAQRGGAGYGGDVHSNWGAQDAANRGAVDISSLWGLFNGLARW